MESSDEVLAETSHAISLCVVAGWPLLSSIVSPHAVESPTGIFCGSTFSEASVVWEYLLRSSDLDRVLDLFTMRCSRRSSICASSPAAAPHDVWIQQCHLLILVFLVSLIVHLLPSTSWEVQGEVQVVVQAMDQLHRVW